MILHKCDSLETVLHFSSKQYYFICTFPRIYLNFIIILFNDEVIFHQSDNAKFA